MSVSLIVILTTTLVAWAQGGSDLEVSNGRRFRIKVKLINFSSSASVLRAAKVCCLMSCVHVCLTLFL